METTKKNMLSKEVKQQMRALKMISRWRTLAFGISSIGVVLAYTGFSGSSQMLFAGICGVILTIVGFAGAAVLNLGIKNGRQNVDKIIAVLEKK